VVHSCKARVGRLSPWDNFQIRSSTDNHESEGVEEGQANLGDIGN